MEAGRAGKDGCVTHEGLGFVRDCYWLGSIFLRGVRMYVCGGQRSVLDDIIPQEPSTLFFFKAVFSLD